MNPQISFLINRSLESLGNSNLDSAEIYLKQALKLQSNNPHVLRLIGVIFAQRGDYLGALKHFEDSLRYFPKNYLTLSNLGNVFLELKEHDKAMEAYDKSISIEPKYAEAWSNKGNALSALKRYEEAITYYDKALSINPNYAEAWSNKGNALSALKRYEEAITYYDKALSINPNYAEAWSNKGNALSALKRYEEAITYYDKALSINPNYAEALVYMGNAYKYFRLYEEVIVCHEKAYALKAGIDFLRGDLQHTKMRICDWNGFDLNLKGLIQGVESLNSVAEPFPMLTLVDRPEIHKQCAKTYIQNKFPFNDALGPIKKHNKSSKIRIGYFSADLRNHAVSFLTAELFELHDKNRFEIFAFSFGVDNKDQMRDRLIQAFDQFIDVQDKSPSEIAKLARDIEIDIAVDLSGHTADSRTEIFSYRAAPIQLSYIGYLGTMGCEYYDYLLADKTIIPDEMQEFYVEKIAYLPSYQANDRKRIISSKQFTREELGLPNTGIVFCCLNNNYKILPVTFDSWMRILKAVEGSVLFLYADSEYSKINLIREAGIRGVEEKRIIFGPYIPQDENLARYRVCDLFLDTAPYNAGLTASDALWAGLPVLTMIGKSFASRYAASLLNAVGLPELITNTQDAYEKFAIELANNPQKLADIKSRLAKNRLIAPLFDTPLFTKNLEAAYIRMFERYQADLPPENITISN